MLFARACFSGSCVTKQALRQTDRAETSAAPPARVHRGLRDRPRPAPLRGSRRGNNRASARGPCGRATIPSRCARALPHGRPGAARAASETAPAAHRELPRSPRSAPAVRTDESVAAGAGLPVVMIFELLTSSSQLSALETQLPHHHSPLRKTEADAETIASQRIHLHP